MAAHAKMVDLGDIGAALCNLPSPKKPEEELDDEPDPMWAIRLGHSGSIKSILEDWTLCGSKSPRASFFRWAARDHISSPVKANFRWIRVYITLLGAEIETEQLPPGTEKGSPAAPV